MTALDFSQLVGNESIKIYLKRMIERQTVANSLLFAGPDGIGKSLFAHAFAAALICQNDPHGHHKKKIDSGNHPDILHYRPEGKLGVHNMQSLRQLCDEAHIPPYEAKKKIIIIHEAERMLGYSANALLKTFEEPPLFTVIILLSSQPSSLIPTILSRCRTLYFHALSQEEIRFFLKRQLGREDEQIEKIAMQSSGSIAKAMSLIEDGESSIRRELFLLLKSHFNTYKEMLAAVTALTEHIETIKKQAEQTAKDTLYKIPSDNMTAPMQHALEKELEGIVSISQVQTSTHLFELILSWYRDLYLMRIGCDKQYLINFDYVNDLEEIVQQGHLLDFDDVQKFLEEAKVALQRSMSLQVCLESLFLKLLM